MTSAVQHRTDHHSAWLPRHRRSAGTARWLLREYLAGHPDGDQYVEVGELLVSELVANAVQHARAGFDRLVLVHFDLADSQLRVEVHDASTERPTLRPSGELDECGRGLRLVDALATGWGVCPRVGGVGKITWCTIGPGPEPVTVEIERVLPPTRYGSLADGLAALWAALRPLPLDECQREAYRYFLTRPHAVARAMELLERDGELALSFAMAGERHVLRVRPARFRPAGGSR